MMECDVPAFMVPACFENHGNYVVSLGNVVRWLGQQAEAAGVDIFPGFAAAEILYNDDGSVTGVATCGMGLDRHGRTTGAFRPGSGGGRLRDRPVLRQSLPVTLRRIAALQDGPTIRLFFEGARRISYGARAITAGGLQALPKPCLHEAVGKLRADRESETR